VIRETILAAGLAIASKRGALFFVNSPVQRRVVGLVGGGSRENGGCGGCWR